MQRMTNGMRLSVIWLAFVCLVLGAQAVWAADIGRFVGTYRGTVDVEAADGTTSNRDLTVIISQEDDGFNVQWSTVTNREDGSSKEKTYAISFNPTGRESVFGAAMQRNVFGKAVPLDPMKGEPYVWARVLGDTMSVYSLFVTPEGGYEIQQFDRTLTDGGLQLEFQNVRNGTAIREISAFLEKE